jgi:hypothetical protein
MIGQVERCDIETLNLPTNDIIAAVLAAIDHTSDVFLVWLRDKPNDLLDPIPSATKSMSARRQFVHRCEAQLLFELNHILGRFPKRLLLPLVTPVHTFGTNAS